VSVCVIVRACRELARVTFGARQDGQAIRVINTKGDDNNNNNKEQLSLIYLFTYGAN